MEALFDALAASDAAAYLRSSRWGYAAVNTAHVLGIALLVGAVVPLDLRLLGLWRGVGLAGLARVLRPMAATGLALAIAAGLLLFSVRPADYAGNPAFLAKIALVLAGTATALLNRNLTGLMPARQASAGAISLLAWIGALIAGRLIAFAGD